MPRKKTRALFILELTKFYTNIGKEVAEAIGLAQAAIAVDCKG
jgi:hypothetical protein